MTLQVLVFDENAEAEKILAAIYRKFSWLKGDFVCTYIHLRHYPTLLFNIVGTFGKSECHDLDIVLSEFGRYDYFFV